MRFVTDPCPDEQAFRFAHGARARSLQEFREVVKGAPSDVVWAHRDHFQHWMRDVLDAPSLAERAAKEGQRARDAEGVRQGVLTAVEEVLGERGGPRQGQEPRRGGTLAGAEEMPGGQPTGMGERPRSAGKARPEKGKGGRR